MSVFDLDQDGETAVRQQAAESGVDFNSVQPGFFDGSIYGPAMGIARGAAKLGRMAALAASVPLIAYETAAGYQPGEITDSYFRTVVKPTDEAVEFYTPNANEVGTAGRVLGTLAEIVVPLAAGAGNPSLLIGSTALNTGADLVKQGVDATTATTVGLVDATAVGIGFRLPFLGSTFAKKAATGAVSNLALGIGATAADRGILQANDYDELAQQYNPLDVEARTVDLLTGIAFGGLAQLQTRGAREIARSERDAALAALNARNYQFETAPGRPADESALAAHQRALEQALKQIQEGTPVDVGDTRVTEARFLELPRETPLARDPEVRALLDELGIRDEAVRVDEASPLARPLADESIVDTPEALGEVARAQDAPPGRVVTPAEPSAPRAAPEAGRAAPDAPRAEPATREGERAEPDDPDVIAAERSLQDSDIVIDTGARDADDQPVTASARESLAAARQEVVNAKREATAFEAAVACALSFGGA